MTIDEEFLFDIIKGLSPSRELYAGKDFLRMMVEKKGVNATIEFVNKIIDILDDEEGLNHNIDFNEDEIKLFKKAKFNYLTRRNFLQTVAWTICGTGFLIYGMLETIQNFTEYFGIIKPAVVDSGDNIIHTLTTLSAKHILPLAEVICGVALINEGYEKLIEYKLDQIARAVTLFGDKINERAPGTIIEP